MPKTCEDQITIRYLTDAYHAMMEAAAIMEGQYGEGCEHVTQLRGAANMIKYDWIPAIQKEDTPRPLSKRTKPSSKSSKGASTKAC